MSTIIQLPPVYSNLEINVLSSERIQEYENTSFEDEILSFTTFGTSNVKYIVRPESIESTLRFEIEESILKYPQTIFLDARLGVFSLYGLDEFETLEDYSSNTIQEIIDEYEKGIESTLQLSEDNRLILFVNPESVESQSSVEDVQLNFIIDFDSINPTVQFGGFTQLNMEIEHVPLPAIESTVIIPDPNVMPVIRPLGLASTINFDGPSFDSNIHRILVYKDDNISKVGQNDATVIAGGIRINPASAVSSTASSGQVDLPSNPVGFMTININGTDYKIPYYNS